VKTWEQVKSSIVSSLVTVYDLALKLMRFIFQFINSVVVQICILILLTPFEIGVINIYSMMTSLLTPWSRVLEKLTGFQLVKKFPAFYGTQKFITVFTSACTEAFCVNIL